MNVFCAKSHLLDRRRDGNLYNRRMRCGPESGDGCGVDLRGGVQIRTFETSKTDDQGSRTRAGCNPLATLQMHVICRIHIRPSAEEKNGR